jgi:hypothetical protein
LRRFYLLSVISLAALLLVGLARFPGKAVAVAVQSTDVLSRTPALPCADLNPPTPGLARANCQQYPLCHARQRLNRARAGPRGVNEPITLTHYETTLMG